VRPACGGCYAGFCIAAFLMFSHLIWFISISSRSICAFY
jgi:hypothetical protein